MQWKSNKFQLQSKRLFSVAQVRFNTFLFQPFLIIVQQTGSAAVGVADQIAIELASQQNITVDEARKQIYFVDSKGLVRLNRGDTLQKHKLNYARSDIDKNMNNLEEVVRELKPTALIGLSGAGKEFPEPIIREMGKNNARPIIFALSNPTSKSECSAEEAYKYTEGVSKTAYANIFNREQSLLLDHHSQIMNIKERHSSQLKATTCISSLVWVLVQLFPEVQKLATQWLSKQQSALLNKLQFLN